MWGIDLLLLFYFLAPFALILVSNELLQDYFHLGAEFHRKYAHILSGLVIIAASYYLSVYELLAFFSALIVAAIVARAVRFDSMHSVKRKSYGNYLYPLTLLLLSALCMPQYPELFRYGVWLLVVPDALAALVGSRWGKQIPKYEKSRLGSGTFFVSGMIVTLLFVPLWWQAVPIMMVLTLTEFVSKWGTDNFSLPMLGALLLFLATV